MTYSALQIFIPAFMIVFVGTITLWAEVRRNKVVRVSSRPGKRIAPEVRLVDSFFKVLLLISFAIAALYSFFPEYYYVTGPIEALDNPFINTIGVLVLATSLLWLVMAEFNIERTIALINSGVNESSFRQLVASSQRLLLTGMLIMFFGLFITLSNVIAILICMTGAMLYDRLQKVINKQIQ